MTDTAPRTHSAKGTAERETIPPGTPPPKISAEVWDGDEQIDMDAEIADVVRIDDRWHVVVVIR